MTLADLTLPVAYAECRGLALVYDYATAVQWYAIQQEHGDPRHIAIGQQLTDGRWMMCGDVLSELHSGGILAWSVPHMTPEWMAAVEIVPMSEAAALLPVTEHEAIET
jgi:hypothetical protein